MEPDAADRVGREPHGGTDDADPIDFSANTNPLTPDGVEAAFADAFDAARAYPAEPPAAYRERAADYVGCRSERVVPTPGGLAAIRLIVELAVGPGDTALVPSPSFAEYAREIRLQGATPEFVPQAEIPRADPTGHALAVVCNPNNPTGNAYDADALAAFAARCREAGTPLLADEAFLGFTDRPSLAGTEGVVVARSLTKLFGLPGLRAGFAVATGGFRDRLATARRPWNVGAAALAAGGYCMAQSEFVERTRARVETERRRLRAALAERFDVYPSDAPFLLCDVGDAGVERVLGQARESGLALRDATTFDGLDSHVRVAVRRPAENDRLIEAMTDV